MERTITIGFLGCGNVGGGVWKLLNGFADDIAHRTGLRFSIKRVLVRSLAKKRDIDFPEGVLTDRVEDVLDDPEISIVLEFLGGEEPRSSMDHPGAGTRQNRGHGQQGSLRPALA